MRPRALLYLDPEHFDVSDDPDLVVKGTAADPGIGRGGTKVRIRDEAFPSGGVPDTAQVIAGAGLTGGGAFSAGNPTLNVASPAGTLTIGSNSVEVTYGDDEPEGVSNGVGSAGVVDEAARIDHVHPHGDLNGGSLHALAGGDEPGFMTAVQGALVDGATENATASTLILRGSDGVLRQIKTSVGTSAVLGVEVKNTTAALTGPAHQYSPMVVLTGNGWTGAASQARNWGLQCFALASTAELHFLSQIDGGGYTSRVSIDSAGNMIVTGDLTISDDLTVTDDVDIDGDVDIAAGLTIHGLTVADDLTIGGDAEFRRNRFDLPREIASTATITADGSAGSNWLYVPLAETSEIKVPSNYSTGAEVNIIIKHIGSVRTITVDASIKISAGVTAGQLADSAGDVDVYVLKKMPPAASAYWALVNHTKHVG